MPRELKINGEMQDVSGSSFLISSAKSGTSENPVDIDMVVKLADDTTEVRGFGQPITPELSRDIALQFIKKSDNAWQLLNDIKSGSISDITAIVNSDGFKALLSLMDPENQIVSGVFGKEIILQILAAKNCEGIRYNIGEMKKTENGKEKHEMTVVIMGVKDITPLNGSKGISEPIAGWEYYKKGVYDSKLPPDGEVHGHSLTRKDLLTKMGSEQLVDNDDDILKVIFGEY